MLDSLASTFDKMWEVVLERTVELVPKLVAGLILLVVGLLVARALRALAARFFLAIRLDRISDRTGISAFLARGDVRHTVAEILATTIYWLVLLLSLELLGLTLGLEGMTAFFATVLGYLPRIAVALVIIAAGVALAWFFGGAVQLAASNAGFPAARAAGAATKYLIGFFALVMALEQLQIATQLLVSTLQIGIAAVALALALAYGLGCRDLARESVQGWLSKSPAPTPPSPDPPGRP